MMYLIEEITPWFDQPGGGTQYKVDLIDRRDGTPHTVGLQEATHLINTF